MVKGEPPDVAASRGTKEVQLAVIATTLVVMAVFAPMGLIQGVMGPFLKHFGVTICFAMLISLFDALTIAPMLSAYLNSGSVKKNPPEDNSGPYLWRITIGKLLKGFERFQVFLENIYELALKFTVRHPFLVLCVSFIVFSVSILSVYKVPGTFAPEQDYGEVNVLLEMPPGTSLDAMNKVGNEAETIVRKNPEVILTSLVVGNKEGESHKAELRVKMKPARERSISTVAFKDRIREQLRPLSSAHPRVVGYDPTGGIASWPIHLNLLGPNIQNLEKYSRKVLERLNHDPKLKDVDTSYRTGREEYQVRLKPELGPLYGMTNKNIGEELRMQIEGVQAAKYRDNGWEYDIRVHAKEDQRDLRSNFNDIHIPNINYKLVKLSDVANMVKADGPASIDRQDRNYYVQVSADLAANSGLSDALADMEFLLKNELKPPPGITFKFVADSENYKEMSDSLIIIMGLGVVFVFLILSSLYESFITPFAIMLALPLSLCGAFFALYLGHETLNVFSILGIIMLLGVSCKNSILLVDKAKQLIDGGQQRSTALILAGRSRLRPILMTSFALIAGTIPIALGINEACRERISMGLAIIGGVISSTALSLVVVPAVFIYIDRFRLWLKGKAFQMFDGSDENRPDPFDSLDPFDPIEPQLVWHKAYVEPAETGTEKEKEEAVLEKDG